MATGSSSSQSRSVLLAKLQMPQFMGLYFKSRTYSEVNLNEELLHGKWEPDQKGLAGEDGTKWAFPEQLALAAAPGHKP